MKIVVCDPISPKGIALLQQRPEFQVVVLPKRLPEAELLPIVADATALVVHSETKVTAKVIAAGENNCAWSAAPVWAWTTWTSKLPPSTARS